MTVHSQRYWGGVFALLVAAIAAVVLAWSLMAPSGKPGSPPAAHAWYYATAVCAKPGGGGVPFYHWKFWSVKQQRWIHLYWSCSPGQTGLYNTGTGSISGVRG